MSAPTPDGFTITVAPKSPPADRDRESYVLKPAEIWVDRGRKSGQPCVYGTRLPVVTLVGYADAAGDEAALEAYPGTTVEDLASARAFLTRWAPTGELPSDDRFVAVLRTEWRELVAERDAARADAERMRRERDALLAAEGAAVHEVAYRRDQAVAGVFDAARDVIAYFRTSRLPIVVAALDRAVDTYESQTGGTDG